MTKVVAKRKTPSELRGEQLKRTAFVDQAKEAFDALRPCKSAERENGFKKSELSKNPKYIEMRMDELYPVKKARPWMLSGKENSKENGAKQSSSLINVSLLSNLAATKRQLIRSEENNASTEVPDDTKAEARQTNERCSQSIFRSVTQLSTRGEELSCLPDIDMNKALKGLATCEPLLVHPGDITGEDDTASLSGSFMSEFQVSGQKIPLDLSLKTYARLVSSSPLSWLHRSIMGSTYNGMPQLKSLSCNVVNQDNSSGSGASVVSQVLNSMSLHSWVYPQSTLPPFVISAMVASVSDRGEVDFLQKRKLAWEDAFRSLYFMFRKNLCKVFYVCTSQFVAMFTGSCESGGAKRSCNGYITQSTRRLRAMLKNLDICYSMPLCKTKMDQTTVEDLAELSELENHNIGQIRRSRSVSNIDNTPESFLAFVGNESVHGLYDLLLNYRYSFEFLPTADVPVLSSPVPFQNAALSSPEIKCSEMVKTEHTSCYMVEIKGEYIPPWIISNICANVGANGQNFEASFVTEPTSVNLNIGLPQVPEKTDPESRVIEGTGETNDNASDIPGSVICPQLQSGHLKNLKYCNKSYTVSLSPS
ncbi:downstream neighbor of Son [Arabidopsis thaliana]|uniref:Downstream neighbor of Son n=1 Tax=Arabidopsis thaliana TaxID=3702 RepID=A0A1I9LR33_ARATH|nr:downstream neighbor of Son [Arabidopsis thaliana]ANM65041.1 downstream neighbor of Son [Arabidopsis thaliana]|eukprot:NP_001327039.1 downstream neighbor of Son [Arabidopsis thaliana]